MHPRPRAWPSVVAGRALLAGDARLVVKPRQKRAPVTDGDASRALRPRNLGRSTLRRSHAASQARAGIRERGERGDHCASTNWIRSEHLELPGRNSLGARGGETFSGEGFATHARSVDDALRVERDAQFIGVAGFVDV